MTRWLFGSSFGGAHRWLLLCALATPVGCSDDGTAGDESAGQTGSTTGDDTNTTLPVTSISVTDTADPSGTGTNATTGDPTATATATDGPTTGTDGSDTDAPTTGDTDATSGTTGDTDATDGTTGGPAYVVEWCNLQFPEEIEEAPGVGTMVYGRVYVEGITDQTEFVDEDPAVVAQFGYGADGSDPAVERWTWVDGEPNPGWDGSMAMGGFGNENNDEYQGDLSFAEAGTYDYAARFSADGGATWVYCDIDGLTEGGYTVDQAGNAVIE